MVAAIVVVIMSRSGRKGGTSLENEGPAAPVPPAAVRVPAQAY
jgi:hypothetical protein